MSALTIYDENGSKVSDTLTDHEMIAARLSDIGVQFERWQTERTLDPEAGQEEVLTVYRGQVDRLNAQYGFQSLDVVALRPDNPNKAEMRRKFLDEHTHSDFEVRFFVDGSGAFYLHVRDKVYVVVCDKGDLISVPEDVPHWFDMGVSPDFKCIRFFTVTDGWIGDFTGSDIAGRLPTYDQCIAGLQ